MMNGHGTEALRAQHEANRNFDGNNPTGPAYVEVHFGRWPATEEETAQNPVLRSLKSALDMAKGSWKQIYSTHLRVMQDDTEVPALRTLRSADYAQQALNRTREQVLKAVDAAANHLQVLGAEIDKRIAMEPGQQQLASEIRRYAASLDHEARNEWMQRAMTARDWTTVKAVISAPAYLSGTVEPTHQRWRNEFLQAEAPGLVHTQSQLKQTSQLATDALQTLNGHAARLIDFAEAGRVRELKKEAQA